MARTYLNELTLLPWGLYSKDNLNISRARKILNNDHYGLDDVKERILEFISTIIKKGLGIRINHLPAGSARCGKNIGRPLNRQCPRPQILPFFRWRHAR